MTMTAQAC